MLQLFLVEHFGLPIHAEIKQSATYELVATLRAATLITPVSGSDARTSTPASLVLFPLREEVVVCTGYPFPFFVNMVQ